MKIAFACDHGGLNLKNFIIDYCKKLGHEVVDFGTYTLDSCDYPVFGKKAALAVANKECDRGILVCSTGIGMSIVANKVKGVRCALLTDENSARLTREHNDTNCMALGEKNVSYDLAMRIVKTWLETDFSNAERHQRRINMIED